MRRYLSFAGVVLALLGSAAPLVGCPSCGTGSPLPWIGVAFYGLVLLHLISGRTRPPAWPFLLAAAGVHAGLILHMVLQGRACLSCLAAATGCATALAALGPGQKLREAVPAVLPWAMAAALLTAPTIPDVAPGDPPRIVVYTQPDCPYCDDLRERVLPEALADRTVPVEYRDAAGHSFVQRTPTMVLTGHGRREILEGLPDVEVLRKTIQAMEVHP